MLTNDQDATKAPKNGKLQAVQNLVQQSIEQTTSQQLNDDDVTDTEIQRAPLDGLNPMLQRYVENVASVAGTTTDPVLLTCLSVAGAVMANKRTAVLRGDDGAVKYDVIPNVFSCFVADAASGKSTAIDLPAKPLQTFDRELYSQYRDALKAPREPGTPEPNLQQFVIGDTTPQAVVKSMHDNCDDNNNMTCGCLMLDDEMSGFFKQAADAKGTSFIKLMCKAFDGKAHKVNRVTSGKYIFNNFSLSFAGAIQTDMLKKRLNDDLLATGFFQRFMWTFDDGAKHKVSRVGQNKDLALYWAQALETIYRDPDVKELEFTTDATALFWSWVENCAEYNDQSDNRYLKEFVSKHSYFVLRVALIFAVLHKQNQIERQDVADAIKVCNYCLYTDRVLLGFVNYGENISNLDQTSIIHNLLQRCVAKGAKVNYRDLSRALGQYPNWVAVKESQYKKRHGDKEQQQDNKQE